MASLTCFPDECLSQTHLNVLFNDFRVANDSGLSDAAVFSSLVNNIRHVYMAALLRARSEELQRDRFNSLPMYDSSTTDPGFATDTETPTPTVVEGGAAEAPSAVLGQFQEKEISWPAKTFTLHVGSYFERYRRDMPSWGCMDTAGWTERLDFKVFKYEEPGTIRVDVAEQHNSHRMMVNTSVPGWQHRLTFHAYGQQRQGTQYIWVGYQAEPDKCIFVKGERGDSLDGWKRILEFWVPK